MDVFCLDVRFLHAVRFQRSEHGIRKLCVFLLGILRLLLRSLNHDGNRCKIRRQFHFPFAAHSERLTLGCFLRDVHIR